MSDTNSTFLKTYSAREFLALELSEPEFLLHPWLPKAGLAMIHAWTGIGKTTFSLDAAVAIASGNSFLKFHAPTPNSVFYLDGEMPSSLMQKRFAETVSRFESFDQSLLRIYCAALTDSEAPDLCTEEGQARVDAQIGDSSVIFLDNISAFCRSGKENEAESWRPVNSWLMAHRRAGRGVVTVHHDNKSGDQRGTSKKLDSLDTVIHLKQPADYVKSQGARFEVHFTKARHFWGLDALPFEASLTPEGWVMSEIKPDALAEAKILKSGGMSLRKIETITGVPKSTLSRHLGA